MWLITAFLGYTLLAFVAFLDKYIVSEERVKPLAFTFFSTVLALPVMLLIPLSVVPASVMTWLVVLATGLSYTFALYTMYRGFSEGEVSHLGPLQGATIPVAVLGVSSIFLGERVTQWQLLAFAFLVLGSFLITYHKAKQALHWQRGAGWVVLSGLFFALFHVGSKYLFSVTDVFSAAVYIWGSIGVVGAAMLVSPYVRSMVFGNHRKERRTKHTSLGIVVVNKVCAVVAVLLIQYAVSAGSVSLVNALAGWQYALLVILVLLVSKFFPRKFHESYARGEVLQELSAVAVIAVGLTLLVI